MTDGEREIRAELERDARETEEGLARQAEYTVEFLFLRQVKVRVENGDDIQAQIDAYLMLSPTQRGRIHKMRVIDPSGQPMFPWEAPDMEWLQSHTDNDLSG